MQLASMQEVYLLGSSLLEPFVAFLLRRIRHAPAAALPRCLGRRA